MRKVCFCHVQGTKQTTGNGRRQIAFICQYITVRDRANRRTGDEAINAISNIYRIVPARLQINAAVPACGNAFVH